MIDDRHPVITIALLKLGKWSSNEIHSCIGIFQNHFFFKFFQKYNQRVKQFGSRSGPTLCPNCLQKLSADKTSYGAYTMQNINRLLTLTLI